MDNQPLTRGIKLLPADGSMPDRAKYYCKTCKQWFASTCGRTGHAKKNPDHSIFSSLTNKLIAGPQADALATRRTKAHTNGNTVLDASARDLLLDYVLGKAKEELNAELDRMFRDLKSQPVRTGRVYVAR